MKDSRFFQSQRNKSLTEGCVRCSEDERGHSERDDKIQIPLWEPVHRRESGEAAAPLQDITAITRKNRSSIFEITRDWSKRVQNSTSKNLFQRKSLVR